MALSFTTYVTLEASHVTRYMGRETLASAVLALEGGTPHALTLGMQTRYTVTKHRRDTVGGHNMTLEVLEGLTWDDAAKAAEQLGAVAGTGTAGSPGRVGSKFIVAGEPNEWIRIECDDEAP